ncbi:Armadillo-type fold [Arabidopsis suecica]|uniref:Armadillo-type fold n=1 Tax=Arabidopsis suecica TaxID=45249 RepID=A0A8T2BMP2_ARASU|nr:Armadillo-type fold [Arabidopsis suecica]
MPSSERHQLAGRSLGELVRKLGERVLPLIIPILSKGLKDPDVDKRQDVCIGLNEVMATAGRSLLLSFMDQLIPTIRTSLCDSALEVRESAGLAFSNMYKSAGLQAMDEIIPTLLEALEDDEMSTTALDGLKQIISVRTAAVLPHILSKLVHLPLSYLRLLVLVLTRISAMGDENRVSWEALARVIGSVPKEGGYVVIPGLCLPKSLKPLLAFQDDLKVHKIVEKLLEVLNTPSESVQRAVSTCLSPLVLSKQKEASALFFRLLDKLMKSDKYGERIGAAFGLEGVVMGFGISSLKKYGLIVTLQEALIDSISVASLSTLPSKLECLKTAYNSDFLYITGDQLVSSRTSDADNPVDHQAPFVPSVEVLVKALIVISSAAVIGPPSSWIVRAIFCSHHPSIVGTGKRDVVWKRLQKCLNTCYEELPRNFTNQELTWHLCSDTHNPVDHQAPFCRCVSEGFDYHSVAGPSSSWIVRAIFYLHHPSIVGTRKRDVVWKRLQKCLKTRGYDVATFCIPIEKVFSRLLRSLKLRLPYACSLLLMALLKLTMGSEHNEFVKAAKSDDEIQFVETSDSDVAKLLFPDLKPIMCLLELLKLRLKVTLYMMDLTKWRRYWTSVLLFSKADDFQKLAQALEDIARKFKSKVAAFDNNLNSKYLLESDPPPNNIEDFCSGLAHGVVSRYYKSEPVPDNARKRKQTVVGKTFDELSSNHSLKKGLAGREAAYLGRRDTAKLTKKAGVVPVYQVSVGPALNELCLRFQAADVANALYGVYSKDVRVRMACLNAVKCFPAFFQMLPSSEYDIWAQYGHDLGTDYSGIFKALSHINLNVRLAAAGALADALHESPISFQASKLSSDDCVVCVDLLAVLTLLQLLLFLVVHPSWNVRKTAYNSDMNIFLATSQLATTLLDATLLDSTLLDKSYKCDADNPVDHQAPFVPSVEVLVKALIVISSTSVSGPPSSWIVLIYTFGYTQRLQKCLKTYGFDVTTFLSTNGERVCKEGGRIFLVHHDVSGTRGYIHSIFHTPEGMLLSEQAIYVAQTIGAKYTKQEPSSNHSLKKGVASREAANSGRRDTAKLAKKADKGKTAKELMLKEEASTRRNFHRIQKSLLLVLLHSLGEMGLANPLFCHSQLPFLKHMFNDFDWLMNVKSIGSLLKPSSMCLGRICQSGVLMKTRRICKSVHVEDLFKDKDDITMKKEEVKGNGHQRVER